MLVAPIGNWQQGSMHDTGSSRLIRTWIIWVPGQIKVLRKSHSCPWRWCLVGSPEWFWSAHEGLFTIEWTNSCTKGMADRFVSLFGRNAIYNSRKFSMPRGEHVSFPSLEKLFQTSVFAFLCSNSWVCCTFGKKTRFGLRVVLPLALGLTNCEQ